MKACVLVVLVVLVMSTFVAIAHASITPNPDTWELPPAPNHKYAAAGLLGSGSTSTLVIARDTSSLGSNTSLIAFAVSGGLVPLNSIELMKGCASTFAANVLVCDAVDSPRQPDLHPTVLYQLGLDPSTGRVVIQDQVTAEFMGPWRGPQACGAAPVYVASTQTLVFAALNYSAPHASGVSPYVLMGVQTGMPGTLQVNTIGVVPDYPVDADIVSMSLNQESTLITFTLTDTSVRTYTFPGLKLISQETSDFPSYAYGIVTAPHDIGVAIYQSFGLNYVTYDFATNQPVSRVPVTNDPLTAYALCGLHIASSSTTASQRNGPCLYVSGVERHRSDESGPRIVSQVKVPTGNHTDIGASTIEGQVTTTDDVYRTVVANDQYLFATYGEIMYRWKATC